MVFIGGHISRSKTLIDTMNVIKNNNGNALQIFASNPRSTKITSINENYFGKNLNDIKTYINKNNFSLVIHSPYTINIANSFIINKRQIDINECYWIKLIIHELQIAHSIGAIGCVIHCGRYTNNSSEIGLINMKKSLDFIINEIIERKLNSKIILETSSGQGTELLFKYEDFLDFYNTFTNIQKRYIKICIDTCHIWAANYHLNEVFMLTEKNNNLNDVAVIHINNSKNPKGSNLDRHETILNKNGFIDINEIKRFTTMMKKVNDNITLILETPSDNLMEEIKIIKNN